MTISEDCELLILFSSEISFKIEKKLCLLKGHHPRISWMACHQRSRKIAINSVFYVILNKRPK